MVGIKQRVFTFTVEFFGFKALVRAWFDERIGAKALVIGLARPIRILE